MFTSQYFLFLCNIFLNSVTFLSPIWRVINKLPQQEWHSEEWGDFPFSFGVQSGAIMYAAATFFDEQHSINQEVLNEARKQPVLRLELKCCLHSPEYANQASLTSWRFHFQINKDPSIQTSVITLSYYRRRLSTKGYEHTRQFQPSTGALQIRAKAVCHFTHMDPTCPLVEACARSDRRTFD